MMHGQTQIKSIQHFAPLRFL